MSKDLVTRIADGLSLAVQHVLEVAKSASARYRRYPLRNRPSGKIRWIHHPDPELKSIQRWLSRRVFHCLPVHAAAYAYRPGVSIADHADVHRKNRFLLRLDLRNFFPSIAASDISLFMQSSEVTQSLAMGPKLALTEDDRSLLMALCCRNGRLTIGAPTSPTLSNAICYQLDKELQSLSPPGLVKYTRYSDDLYFSSSEPDMLRDIESAVSRVLRSIKYPTHLYLNREKTRHMSPKRRKTVTGLVITTGGRVSVGRETKRRVRAAVCGWDRLDPAARLTLAGMLAHLQNVEPAFVARLYAHYGPAKVDQARRPRLSASCEAIS